MSMASTRAISLSESEKKVLGLIFHHHQLTQASLTELTGLTQQSVSRVVHRLLADGLLLEGEKISTGKRGYPSTSFRLNAAFGYSLGVALMADCVVLTVLDFAGEAVCERRTSEAVSSRTQTLTWLQQQVTQLRSTVLTEAPLLGAGVGITGAHVGDGVSFNPPFALEEWFGVNVAEVVADVLQLPVWAENDGKVAALGEARTGVGRWASSFAYFYLATGVGGGVVLDGKLWRGVNGNAGEFAGGLPPNIFPFPNLELLRLLVAQEGQVFGSVDAMLQQYDPSWSANQEWVHRVRDSLSIMASNATAILDLDAIVLGGRIPRELAELAIPAVQLFDQKRRAVDRPTARIVAAEAAGESTSFGAAILPLQQQFFS